MFVGLSKGKCLMTNESLQPLCQRLWQSKIRCGASSCFIVHDLSPWKLIHAYKLIYELRSEDLSFGKRPKSIFTSIMICNGGFFFKAEGYKPAWLARRIFPFRHLCKITAILNFSIFSLSALSENRRNCWEFQICKTGNRKNQVLSCDFTAS